METLEHLQYGGKNIAYSGYKLDETENKNIR